MVGVVGVVARLFADESPCPCSILRSFCFRKKCRKSRVPENGSNQSQIYNKYLSDSNSAVQQRLNGQKSESVCRMIHQRPNIPQSQAGAVFCVLLQYGSSIYQGTDSRLSPVTMQDKSQSNIRSCNTFTTF